VAVQTLRRPFGPRARRAGRSPRVAVIGAGIGGLGAGVKLLQAGIDTFEIFEKSDDLGGVWAQNTYPGAAVDTPSLLYTYSFEHHDWKRSHARQPEILAYLHKVADAYGLRPHIRLGTRVTEAVWVPETLQYRLRTDAGEEGQFDAVISAVGLFNEPRYPSWPGLEIFRGPKFHSARWEHDHDLTGKRVAVVGTGSSAAQIVPQLAETCAQVLVFQREPGWILPKGEREFTDDERRAFRRKGTFRRERVKLLWSFERRQHGAGDKRPGTHRNIEREALCRNYIASVFADRPDLAKLVTPSYPYSGKRPIIDSRFYPALLRDDVELVPFAVDRVTPDGVVDSAGVEHRIDALVMATGFKAADYLSEIRVVGRDGRTLREHWSGEPEAFVGVMVPNFPNFFLLYGPNTNGGTMINNLERQAEYATAAIKLLRRPDRGAVAVRESAHRWYNAWLQGRLEGTIWQQTNNYFKAPSGKVVTQWPEGALLYGVLTKLLRRVAWQVHRRPRSA
jgi:cation diffusion facilitator CzcD-associated flavoprotein CzcO